MSSSRAGIRFHPYSRGSSNDQASKNRNAAAVAEYNKAHKPDKERWSLSKGGSTGAKLRSKFFPKKAPNKVLTPAELDAYITLNCKSHSSNLLIWTDGSTFKNPGPSGCGMVVQFLDGRPHVERFMALGHGTNNIAELTAIDMALDFGLTLCSSLAPEVVVVPSATQVDIFLPPLPATPLPGPRSSPNLSATWVDNHELKLASSSSSSSSSCPSTSSSAVTATSSRPKELHILTDSSYSIGVLTRGWQINKNGALIAHIKSKLTRCRREMKVNVHWLKGHAGHIWNDKADALAKKGSTESAANRGGSSVHVP